MNTQNKKYWKQLIHILYTEFHSISKSWCLVHPECREDYWPCVFEEISLRYERQKLQPFSDKWQVKNNLTDNSNRIPYLCILPNIPCKPWTEERLQGGVYGHLVLPATFGFFLEELKEFEMSQISRQQLQHTSQNLFWRCGKTIWADGDISSNSCDTDK
jgi:hypothetical protein